MRWPNNLAQKPPNWLRRTDCQFSGSIYNHFGAFLAPMRHPTSVHYKSHLGEEGKSAFFCLLKKLNCEIFWRRLALLTNCSEIHGAPVTSSLRAISVELSSLMAQKMHI